MTNRKYTILQNIITLLIVGAFFVPALAQAQMKGLSLTVAPPLFQFTLTPGESWASSVKVVNGNSYDIEIYANPVNFEPIGEGGKGKFIPLSIEDNASSSHSLAGWIDITKDPVYIPKGESKRIPFFVSAPENAEPGGHYASILIGTRPVGREGESQMQVSSLISTLLFARVSGDIIEEGRIREFSTEKILYETPEANFTLRFENIGNVHLLPRGSIVIYNMWGKERGRIDVNKDTNFGNVFPGSIRNFEFTWEGENNFYDIGRYKAISTLSYGAGVRQSDFNILYFWVIPIKPLLWILGVLIVLISFIFLALRRYVKHALKMQTELLLGNERQTGSSVQQKMAQQEPQRKNITRAVAQPQQKQKTATPIQILGRPVIQGAVDLRRAGVGGASNVVGESLSRKELFVKYKTFIIFSVGFVACLSIAIFFFMQVTVDEREYDIQIQENSVEATTTTQKSEV